jgi:hypothetical protein
MIQNLPSPLYFQGPFVDVDRLIQKLDQTQLPKPEVLSGPNTRPFKRIKSEGDICSQKQTIEFYDPNLDLFRQRQKKRLDAYLMKDVKDKSHATPLISRSRTKK